MAKKDFGCGREECCASTGIDGSVTFGTGKLDDNGYWEHPCEICRRAWRWCVPPLHKEGGKGNAIY